LRKFEEQKNCCFFSWFLSVHCQGKSIILWNFQKYWFSTKSEYFFWDKVQHLFWSLRTFNIHKSTNNSNNVMKWQKQALVKTTGICMHFDNKNHRFSLFSYTCKSGITSWNITILNTKKIKISHERETNLWVFFKRVKSLFWDK